MMRRKISVIIPLYNKQDFIIRAVDSVLAQKKAEFELIVVDDGSSDDSLSQLFEYKNYIKIITQNNCGPSAARNAGAIAAKYNFLCFLDADDEFKDGFLAEHLEMREMWPSSQLSIVSHEDCIVTNCIVHDLTSRRQGIDEKDGFVLYKDFYSDFVMNVPSGAICINKELFSNIGGYDVKLKCWEISEFLLRVLMTVDDYVISNNCLLKIHRNAKGGQFSTAISNADYLLRYSIKIIDRLESMSSRERLVFSKYIKTSLAHFLRHGSLDEFVYLARYSRKKVRFVDYGHMKLNALSYVPMSLLKSVFLR